jgi:hypothetical protein
VTFDSNNPRHPRVLSAWANSCAYIIFIILVYKCIPLSILELNCRFTVVECSMENGFL